MLMVNNKDKQYSLSPEKDDPLVSLRLPSKMVRDLALRSQENGSSIELEIAIRLARTLERDLEMNKEDDECARIALKYIKKAQKQ